MHSQREAPPADLGTFADNSSARTTEAVQAQSVMLRVSVGSMSLHSQWQPLRAAPGIYGNMHSIQYSERSGCVVDAHGS